jgi:hypothetical protein
MLTVIFLVTENRKYDQIHQAAYCFNRASKMRPGDADLILARARTTFALGDFKKVSQFVLGRRPPRFVACCRILLELSI